MIKTVKKIVLIAIFSFAFVSTICMKIYLSNCNAEEKVINVPNIEEREGGEDPKADIVTAYNYLNSIIGG